ncbi:hypothetical protein [Mailhella massiliensis]|uniref:hypothetical protein n=1 Tax=Mailhella massiliensis TaxID=1903261 RepID=UPI0023EF7FB3|nr:hypothetical protein [Mailhella massiliensis]
MTIPAAVFLLSIFWRQGILSSMTDRQNITIGRVRQAYGLTAKEGEMLVQAFWPDAVQPLELWRGVYETCWQAFVASRHVVYGTQLPEFPSAPEPDTGIQTYLLGFDVMEFFRTISTVVPLNSLRYGMDVILEESFEDTASVFPEEREFLFSSLERLKAENIFEQYSPDSPLFEKTIFSIPASSYHFIAHIFADTIMVDRDVAIRYLRYYPLRREVKGITRALVEAVLQTASPESSVADKAAAVPLCERSPQDEKLVFRIPGAFWEGRPDAAVRDAMKEKYPLAVIAYVLLYWCGPQKSETSHKTPQGRKTHVGRLLAGKEYRDDKSYRNLMDMLLKEAETYAIIKA